MIINALQATNLQGVSIMLHNRTSTGQFLPNKKTNERIIDEIDFTLQIYYDDKEG